MSHSGVSLENQNVKRDADNGGIAHEVLEGSKNSLGNWVGEHLFCILAKNLMFSAHVLRTQVRLNSKVMDNFV